MRARFWFPLLALLLTLLLPALAYSQPAMPDYEIKAAILYRFTQFIEWRLPDSNAPFLICVADDPTTAGTLEHLARGKSVGRHPLKVRGIRDATEAQPCRMLFLGAAAGPLLQQYLQAVSSALTVGEGSDFINSGGMIELFVEDRRMAFRMNLPALQRAGLNASSRLLQLAHRAELHTSPEGYH